MPAPKPRPDIQDVQARDLPDDRPTQFLEDEEAVWGVTIIPDQDTLKRARAAMQRPPVRASWRFMLTHPAHVLALGFGAGLVPRGAGTAGTLWAWASFLVLDIWLGSLAWAVLLTASFLVGWWACTRTAQHLGTADPGAVVWDEVLAFWLILWVVTPQSTWDWQGPALWTVLSAQLAAFIVFRYFDVAKPGPVGWADRVFEARHWRPARGAVGWAQGMGILLDDLVAAALTLLVMALGLAAWSLLGVVPEPWR